MKSSQAADGFFDIREDEEQFEKLQHCLDLLIAAGYFRARVKGISAFDKIVGGMVWCISSSLSSHSIDVNLLFAENSSIGQKIALTEKIVEVLPHLKCPYSIEPHQIQGFDYIHVFPVIQWLVKRACEAREEHGDHLKKYATHLYKRKCPSSPSSTLSSRLSALSSEVGAPSRQFKKIEGIPIDSLPLDIKYTLAEYGHARLSSGNDPSSVDSIDSEDNEGLQITSASGRTKLSSRAMKTLAEDESMSGLFHALEINSEEKRKESAEDTRKRTKEIKLETEELEQKNEAEKVEVLAQLGELKEKDARIAHYQQLLERFSPAELEELTNLVNEYSSVSHGENEFKKECKDELESMTRQIQYLRDQIKNAKIVEDDGSLSVLSSMESSLSSLRVSTADSLRRLNGLQRRVDEVPSEAEIAQYHKRFIELGNDILSEHRRLRGAFDEYNTMVDVKEYLHKENDLLNTVEDIMTKSQGDYRDSLNEKLAVVLIGLEKTLDKLSCKESLIRKEGETLGRVVFDMREKERSYYRTVEAVHKAYERNDELRRELKRRGMKEIDS